MQDFSQISLNTTATHSFEADYDAEAKATFLQVERDLQQRQQIVRTILMPIKRAQAHNIDNTIAQIRIGSVMSMLLCGGVLWWLNEFILVDTPLSPLFLAINMSIFVLIGCLQWICLPKLFRQQANKSKHQSIYLHLDKMNQTISLVSFNMRYPAIYSFHGKDIFRRMVKLPSFALPQTEQAKYMALRTKLQREISEMTGLIFKD